MVKYELTGSTMQALIIQLEQGETVFTESGAMAWMSQAIQMDSNFKGGVLGSIGRLITGESLALTTFTAKGSGGEVAFAPQVPGKVVAVSMEGHRPLIVQKRSFLCAQEGIDVKVHFQRKLWGGLFGGEGFILQRVTGNGMAFFEIDGEVVEKQLAAGEVLRVDTGHVAVFEEGVDFDITTVSGIKNMIFGGEGLFLTTLKGPGRVWLQTMPFTNLVGQIVRALPRSGGGGKGAGSFIEGLFEK